MVLCEPRDADKEGFSDGLALRDPNRVRSVMWMPGGKKGQVPRPQGDGVIDVFNAMGAQVAVI